MPADWAITTTNLANALETLGEINGDDAQVEAAITLLGPVIATFEAMAASAYVEIANRNRDRMIALRDRLRGGSAPA